MKQTLLLILLHIFAIEQVKSCDVCGGAINTGGSDIIPGMYRHFLAVRSNIQHFSSEHLTLFPGEQPLLSQEWFVNSELFGRYVPHRRVHLNGVIPYNSIFKLEEGNHLLHLSGLGDVRISGNFLAYEYLENKNKEAKELELNWFVGLGAKLPTGNYRANQTQSGYFHPNMLPGTGTYDFFGHTDLIVSKNMWGGTANFTYMLRGTNSLDYAFGDIFSSRVTGFYKHLFNEKATLMLETGVLYSNIGADKDLRWNETLPYSEGWMLAPFLRCNYFYNNWVFQLGANKALAQKLALGQVQQHYQLEFALIRFF
jgi:hypothetical protein